MNHTNPEASMRTAPTTAVAKAVTGDASTEPVLTAHGIEKAYRRGVWPLRRARRVLRGVDLALQPGEVVGWSARTVPASPR